MTVDLASVSDSVSELGASFDDLTEELDEIIGNDNSTDNELDDLKERVDVLESNFEELSGDFNALVDDLDEIIGHDNETDAEVDLLKEHVDQLQTGFKNLTSQGEDFEPILTQFSKQVYAVFGDFSIVENPF